MKAEASHVESAVRVLKVATCPSLTGRSKLTYHVGQAPDFEILFRVVSNTGGGFFSQEWASLGDIKAAFAKASGDKELTSFHLYPLFAGKSVNTPAFLLAALKNEGLVRPSTTKRRCYERVDEAMFVAAMQAWAASGKAPKGEDKPKKGHSKTMKGAAQLQPAELMPEVIPKVLPKLEPNNVKAKSGPKVAAKGKRK